MAAAKPRAKQIFTLQIAILGGPMTKSFARKNPVISRTIEARGGHTLADLHGAIFKAFDREDEYLYEFQFGGSRPMDPEARRYGPPMAMVDPFGVPDGSGWTISCSLGRVRESWRLLEVANVYPA